MARLDPSPWNLGAPLVGVVLGACGPLVPVDDGGDTGTSVSTTDPTGPNPTGPNPTGPNPTGPNPTTVSTTAPSCYDVGCPPGYHCENGYCVYDGCYYDDGYGCCYDTCCGFECGWYGDCFSNVDCPVGYACQYNYCQASEQELECEIIALDFHIPIAGAGGDVRSLAFMDGNGDLQFDVVVGQAGTVQYVDGATLAVSDIASDVNAEHLATGDLDNDGDDDIVIADGAVGGGILILQNDGNWTPYDAGGESQNLRGVALGDVEGDGFRDIWGWSDGNGTFLASNYGGWMITEAEYVWDPATSIAVGDADGDILQDTAIYSYQTYVLTDGPAFNGWGLWDATSREDRQLVMANFNAEGFDDVVVMQAVNGVTLVTSFAGPVIQSAPHHSWWQVPVTAAVSDDVNDDGYRDIVGASGGSPLSIAFGAPESPPDVINCVQYVSPPISASRFAVGDLTGDGRSDVAVSDGVSVVVMAQSG